MSRRGDMRPLADNPGSHARVRVISALSSLRRVLAMRPGADECAEVVSARELAPSISARAVEFQQARRLAPETVQAMADAGLVQMAIPTVYGGV